MIFSHEVRPRLNAKFHGGIFSGKFAALFSALPKPSQKLADVYVRMLVEHKIRRRFTSFYLLNLL